MTLDNVDPFFVALDDNVALIADYEAAKTLRDEADAEMRRLRDMIIKLLPNSSEAPDGAIGTVAGAARVSYRPQVRRQLNHHKLRRDYPSVCDTCTDYATTWVVRTIPEPPA
jgi:hypothetical protein